MMLNGKAFVHKMCGKKDSPHECRGILSQLLFFHDLSDGDARELEFCGLVFILISKVYNCFFSNLPATIAYQKQYSRLHNAIDYIHNHYGEEINVPLLAKLSHLAVGTFCRYFKQLLGESPVSYMNNYRIRRSSVLLIESSLKISEIAFSCGYNNLSHFNRDFKNRMGCTPTQYRSY
jgi:AraC-like DNA-binding protein